MVTTLYLRATTNALSGTFPTTEQSSRTSANDFEANQATNRVLSVTKGTAQTSLANTSTGTTSQTDYYIGRWVSDLVNQTSVAANTWTLNVAGSRSGTSARFPSAGSGPLYVNCYVWKPSDGTKYGTILDGATGNRGGTNSTSERSHQVTFTGSAVSSLTAGDAVIIFEFWAKITQSDTSTYTQTFYFDGATVTASDGTAVSDHASFISTPENITFGGALTQVNQTFTHLYKIVGRTAQSYTHKYKIRQLVSATKTHIYKIRSIVNATKTHVYKIRALVNTTKTHKYKIVGRASATKTHIYKIVGRISVTKTHIYKLRALVNASKTFKYKIVGRTFQSFTHKYNIKSLINRSLTHKYKIVGRASQIYTHVYKVRQLVTQTYTHKYKIALLVSNSYTHFYKIIGRATKTYTHLYKIRSLVNATKTFKYKIVGRIAQVYTHVYKIRQLVNQDFTHVYNILEIGIVVVGRAFHHKYKIVGRKSTSLYPPIQYPNSCKSNLYTRVQT